VTYLLENFALWLVFFFFFFFIIIIIIFFFFFFIFFFLFFFFFFFVIASMPDALDTVVPLAHLFGHIHNEYGVRREDNGMYSINAATIDKNAAIVFDVIIPSLKLAEEI
jgi:hypothetical protein